MEHASERAGGGHEAPGAPKNAAAAQPEEAVWSFQLCQGGDLVNQTFLLGGTSEKRR